MKTWTILLVAGATLLSACTRSDSATTPAATEATIAPVVTTTTAEPVGSTSPTVPSTPATAPVTTQPLPAPEVPAADLAVTEELLSQYTETVDALHAAAGDPFNFDLEAAAREGRTGAALDQVDQVLDGLRAAGVVERINSAVPPTITTVGGAEVLDDGSGVTTIEVCEVDSRIVVEPGEGVDDADRVVDDTVTTRRLLVRFVRFGENWVLSGTDELARFDGAADCVA